MAEEIKVNLKLLVDTESKKVLFAEAGKDFVDFLFHILELPIGAIVKLLKVKEKDMAGCLGDLYKSIESLKGDLLLENVSKDAVLNPRAAVSVPLLSIEDAPRPPTNRKVYRCYNSYHTFTGQISTDPNTNCPQCSNTMSTELTYINPKSSAGATTSSKGSGVGFVKEVLTYMVMDNLEVKPSSTISAIALLNKFHVKDVASLVEKEVQVGLNEGVAILKASLETRAVLSTVFLGKKAYGFESS